MDTCDHCGPSVQARVVVSMPSGLILMYCRHCAVEYRPKLKDQGAFLYPLRVEDDEEWVE